MENSGTKNETTLTEKDASRENDSILARETFSNLPDDGLDAIVRFLARRAAERDFAAFSKEQWALGHHSDTEGA